MQEIPLYVLVCALAALLVCSAFFSLSETSMMALNRYRLRHYVRHGHRGARLASGLLDNTDRFLGVVLLGNNLLNAAAALLVGEITRRYLGESEFALAAATAAVTFAILVFSEITPKVIGATFPERIAFRASYVLVPLLRIAHPAVWFVNLFVQALLRLLRVDPKTETPALTMEELRSLVLEGSHYLPQKHRSILLNLFELEQITVEDVMTPRAQLEAIDLDAPMEEVRNQILTCYHTRLPVYRGDPNNMVGILHVRRVLNLGVAGTVDADAITKVLREPYFVPSGTSALSQLQHFQENRDRLGLVVDEYGELMGLVTIDDILEEIIGEFVTHSPLSATSLHRDPDGSVLVEGGTSLRELNRKLGLAFPLGGPKTLNGLILEHLRDIPEPGVSLKIGEHALEIVQTASRSVRAVRIRPAKTPQPAQPEAGS